MKYIYDDPRTQHLLKIWASSVPLCVGSFFFWNSGTWEQKSQQGLLRALLFQVLNENPDLIPIVFPLTWSRTYTRLIADKAGLVNESWSLRLLKDGFKLLVKQEMVPLNLCFFIDGLDEFEGDHEDMAELFKDITSPTVKVCLSSRPWIVFKMSFQSCPGLQLQDLTQSDIELYVQEILAASTPFQRLATKNPSSTATFVQEIVEKADGVFLWVVLVVRFLLNGIRNRDSVPDLQNRLRIHLIIEATTIHSTPELLLPPTIHPLSRCTRPSNMLASNLAKFILKRYKSIGQPLARRSNNTCLAYVNGVKPSPILLLDTTSLEKTAFYATHTPYRSINLGNVRSLSSTCIIYPADVKYYICPYLSKASLFRSNFYPATSTQKSSIGNSKIISSCLTKVYLTTTIFLRTSHTTHARSCHATHLTTSI